MADLKTAINDMVKKGLSEQVIVSNLRELGVQNPQRVYADALAAPPRQNGSQPASQAKEQQLLVENASQKPVEQPRVFTNVGKTTPVIGLDELNAKVDDLSAQLKALSELNQKILDSNREVLLRLKRS
ncbi:hypothetical protein HY993_01125 [Candidatus Micrarchaeota archaeon]|nr:hypothetical protein [Candidatus Micrarchaeota archaeon]